MAVSVPFRHCPDCDVRVNARDQQCWLCSRTLPPVPPLRFARTSSRPPRPRWPHGKVRQAKARLHPIHLPRRRHPPRAFTTRPITGEPWGICWQFLPYFPQRELRSPRPARVSWSPILRFSAGRRRRASFFGSRAAVRRSWSSPSLACSSSRSAKRRYAGLSCNFLLREGDNRRVRGGAQRTGQKLQNSLSSSFSLVSPRSPRPPRLSPIPAIMSELSTSSRPRSDVHCLPLPHRRRLSPPR